MGLMEGSAPGREGRVVLDREGRNIGTLRRVYGDDDPPMWGAVKPGRFGRSHVVPLRQARSEGDEIRVAATKDQVEPWPSPARAAP